MLTLSEKLGIAPKETPIAYRYQAPSVLREELIKFIREMLFKQGYRYVSLPKFILERLGETDKKALFLLKFGTYPSESLPNFIKECEWVQVYDIPTYIFCWLKQHDTREVAEFEKSINLLFYVQGIGWRMEQGEILVRGDEIFESTISTALTALNFANPTAENELKEALLDLSRKPEADITGVIQHSRAAFNCLIGHVTKTPDEDFGKMVAKHFPQHLKAIANQIYGLASNSAVHIKEGKNPTFEEAKLVLEISASLISYTLANQKTIL